MARSWTPYGSELDSKGSELGSKGSKLGSKGSELGSKGSVLELGIIRLGPRHHMA